MSELGYKTMREALQARGMQPEDLDPTPVEIPADKVIPLSLKEELQRFIRTEISAHAEEDGKESFEDFNDFSLDDEEPDLTSPYTVDAEGVTPYPVDEDVHASQDDASTEGQSTEPLTSETTPTPPEDRLSGDGEAVADNTSVPAS